MFNLEKTEEIYVSILVEVWNDLLVHYDKLGITGGYAHQKEEDLRCLLFSKIFQLLEKKEMPLLDISTEVKLPKKRIDILLSNEASNFALGVEIKRKREIDDLGKLGTFMDEEKISIGAFVTFVNRSKNKPFQESPIYQKIKATYAISDKDNGVNNFIVSKNIRNIDLKINWAAVLIVMRHKSLEKL
jgi:hypothetical protein